MAKTLGNLRTGVRVILDEAQQVDFLDSEVLREINYAYHDVIGAVMEVYEGWYDTPTAFNITTVATQQQYTLDPSIIKTRRVEINYQPTTVGSQGIKAIPIELDELPLNLSNQGLGGSGIFNAGYYVLGNIGAQVIGFVPIPQIAGTNAITVWATALPADLVNDSDNVNIPWADRFAKLVELKAGAELLRKGQQEVKAADDLMVSYQQGLLQMKSFIKDRKSDGVDMVQDLVLEDVQFDNPL